MANCIFDVNYAALHKNKIHGNPECCFLVKLLLGNLLHSDM